MTLKECVAGRVKFHFFRRGNLYYRCANGFVFPVPVTDTGDGVFSPEDKGVFFMRWIRKELAAQAADQG